MAIQYISGVLCSSDVVYFLLFGRSSLYIFYLYSFFFLYITDHTLLPYSRCGLTMLLNNVVLVLGPILFTIYINDLPDVVQNIAKIFADDTKVYAVVNRYRVEGFLEV
jgi:hypothetical protein